MSCAERQRLFDLYFYQVTRYEAVVRQIHENGAGSTTEEEMLVDAKNAAEGARTELERHDQKHGCRAASKSHDQLMVRGATK